MIALRLVDPCPWPGGYSSHVVACWLPGEVRELDEAEADRLLSTFPGVFVQDAPVEPPAPADDTPRKRGRKAT